MATYVLFLRIIAVLVIIPFRFSLCHETENERVVNQQSVAGRIFATLFHNSSYSIITPGDPDSCYCTLLINEINTDSSSKDPSLFIELMRVYSASKRHRKKPSNLLTDQYVVILRASPLSVVFYADLTEQRLHLKHEAEVFVLGDPGLPELGDTGISLRNDAIESIYKNTGSERLLPTGDDSPYALLLLHAKNRRRDVTWMSLEKDNEGNYKAREFHDSLLSRIRPCITDMLVFGKKTPVSTCSALDNLWPDEFHNVEGKSYILRDWDVSMRQDYSLNRCGSTRKPFQIQTFQYDKPSPGRHNPCEGHAFFVEDIIDKVAPLQGIEGPELPGCSASLPGLPSGSYISVQEKLLATYKEDKMPEKCASCDTGTTSEVEKAMDVAVNNGIIENLGGNGIEIKLIVNSEFDEKMVELARPYLPDDGALVYKKDVQQWLRVTKPTVGDDPVAFHCAACLKMYGDKQSDVLLRGAIATNNGYFNVDKYKNAKKIRSHSNTPTHKDAVEFSYKLAMANSEKERDRCLIEYQQKFESNLLPTVNMIRTVYAEALAEVPFMYHPVIVDMQEANGVNLGFHHYHEKAASQALNQDWSGPGKLMVQI